MSPQPPTSVLVGLPHCGGGRRIVAGAPLTPRQQVVLDMAWAYLHETGEEIDIRELTKRLGHASTSGTMDHVRSIEQRGVYFPRVGKTAPYVDMGVIDSAEVERLRSLYWMHRFEASYNRAQGRDRDEHLRLVKEYASRLSLLGACLASRPDVESPKGPCSPDETNRMSDGASMTVVATKRSSTAGRGS